MQTVYGEYLKKEIEKRKKVLADFLKVEVDTINDDLEIDKVEDFRYTFFEIGSREYMVLTDKEANESTKDYIRESLWTFNPSFLAEFTGIDRDIFKLLSEHCEKANDAILKLIGGKRELDKFVEDAIVADGRGHFLNTYDGKEHEHKGYFIYRIG